eukprot:6467668-Amphidinium_carterae.3
MLDVSLHRCCEGSKPTNNNVSNFMEDIHRTAHALDLSRQHPPRASCSTSAWPGKESRKH